MTASIATTPFGRRKMTLGLLAHQRQAPDADVSAGAGQGAVHKWQLLQHITAAKDSLGLADRSLSVLHALLSFHQETALSPGERLIVFPSNTALSARAHGMAIATLQRHLALLVDAGLILRRDSPNGKRYQRRGGPDGDGEAFGFDLSPLVRDAALFQAMAEDCAREARRLRAKRETVMLLRRDCAKKLELLASAEGQGTREENSETLLAALAPLSRRLPRQPLESDLDPLLSALERLLQRIDVCLNDVLVSQATWRNASHSEAHNQNQNTQPEDIEPPSREVRGEVSGSAPTVLPEAAQGLIAPETKSAARALPLGFVLSACPDIISYAPGGRIEDFARLIEVARIIRSMLGVSPDAWNEAVTQMGERDAAIAMAAILQKGAEIRSPGGYLRVLTRKAGEGAFSPGAVLMALTGKRLKAKG